MVIVRCFFMRTESICWEVKITKSLIKRGSKFMLLIPV